MFTIERRTALLLRTAVRLCSDGPARHADATPILFRHTKDGWQAHFRTPEVAVVYAQPGPSRKGVIAFEASALAQFEGKTDEPVVLERTHPARAVARWTDSIPRELALPCVEPEKIAIPPELPRRFAPVPAAFLEALHQASQTASKSDTKYAVSRVQVRGTQGQVVGTDTRQLLIQGGFEFPFTEDLLVLRTRLFGHPAFRPEEGVEVGRTETHLVITFGPWRVALTISTQGRYPDVNAIVPRAGSAATRLALHPEDAGFFVDGLARLLKGPDASELPVTLDLGRGVPRLRFRLDGKTREVALERSEASGAPVRVCVALPALLRAVELGLGTFEVRDPVKPFVARDGERVYLAMPLPAEQALGPGEDVVPLSAPAPRRKRVLVPVRRAAPAPVAVGAPVGPVTVVVGTPATSALAPFDVFAEAEGLKDAAVRVATHAGRLLRWLREVCGRAEVLQVARGSLHALADRLPSFTAKEQP